MFDTISVILLAAGGSSRLGAPKQLVMYKGKTLLRRSAQAAVGSRCGQVIVVFGSVDPALDAELHGLTIKRVVNTDWQCGIGTSIRCGMEALRPGTEAVVIMLCDQPLVTSDLLNRLMDMYHTSGSQIVASEYAETVGVPALFSDTYFTDLLSLPPDHGAKKLLLSHASGVLSVPFPAGIIDVDTPEDVERLNK